ncbi:dicarboxylate/amino acid:cation symporter [Shewanella eurypsychrophilus]|uniref:Dicarboxylate/amino acid:cation symporter n=1 Tax=Shewanella eurypsychrophilus TaxID=2593656 RepID=A0ABX6VAF4_9GAMM|nr:MULTISPECIES: dicarboxylate/amino acid:cation symporter [Shewanella]QFU23634.1 cation:dicarboxylase symporter family transporter [Shewanella sp. YLB-09]QPG58856.1 dicarboxylate/amino acid:cation symporter [Shewanella eurypsychrophilus]
MKLHWQIMIAIVIALFVGLMTSQDSNLYQVYGFIGTLFLNALKMVIVPLIMASIISSMASLNQGDNLGRLGLKTLGYYATTSLIAILIGLTIVNITTPGIIDGVPAGEMLNLHADSDELASTLMRVEGRGSKDVLEIFIRMVPTNIVSAAAEGQMLGLIFFSLLFGFFMGRVEGRRGEVLRDFWTGVSKTMVLITQFVLRFAPIGIFALIAKTVSATGFDAFEPMLVFLLTVMAALAVHAFVALPILLRFVGGVSPLKQLTVMSPAMLMAFSTASSSATLPLTMECVKKRAGVSRKTASFVLPLGATVNMDGTALYECVAAMFIAQAYGLELGFVTQFTIVLVALLTSIGVAGIPAASLVAITVILGAIGLPLEAIGLLLVTDRILDMLRTAVNVYSDACGTVIIARSEGETWVLSPEQDHEVTQPRDD